MSYWGWPGPKIDGWAVFDQLAATSRPRRAVWCFVGLSLLSTLSILLGYSIIGDRLFFQAARVTNPLGALILLFGFAYLWLMLHFTITRFALVLGGHRESDPS